MNRYRPAILALALAALVVFPATHGAAAVAEPSPADIDRADVADPIEPETVLPGSSGTGLPGPGAALLVEQQSNTTNYLTVPDGEVEQGGFATPDVDVGDAVASDVDRLEQEYATHTFERAVENASADDRHRLIRTEMNRIEDRIDALERKQTDAITAYNEGEITTEQFLARIAKVDTAARAVDARRGLVEQTARDSEVSRAVLVQLANIESDLVPLWGPVRQEVSTAVAGTAVTGPVYTVTSEDAVTLAQTNDRLYDRETYLGSRRDPGGENLFEQGDEPSTIVASDRGGELYPWLYSQVLPSTRQFGNTSVYYISAETRAGLQFDAYLDGTTRDVFREVQTKRVDSVPTYTIANRTDELRIRANHTHGTGPMTVVVTDPETGEPIDASVTVNGHAVGNTGYDGRLTTITPYDAVRIRATTATNESIRLPFFSR